MMELIRHVRRGDTVVLHFTGRLEDGSVFDSSEDKDPLSFKVGAGDVILGLEEAVIGMKSGNAKEIHISSDKAYGPREKELIVEVNRDQLPEGTDLKLDDELSIPDEDGRQITVKVKEINADKVILDANHPLAGKNLIFEIRILEIKK